MHMLHGDWVRCGDLVHLHDDDGLGWGIVLNFKSHKNWLRVVLVRSIDGRFRRVDSTYVNKAVLGLDGPHCLRCEQEARST